MEAEALKDRATLEDLSIWTMEKVKSNKKGSRTYYYWMATWRDEGEISCRRLRARMINLEDKASSRRALPQEVKKIQIEYQRVKTAFEQLLNLVRLLPREEKEMMEGEKLFISADLF